MLKPYAKHDEDSQGVIRLPPLRTGSIPSPSTLTRPLAMKGSWREKIKLGKECFFVNAIGWYMIRNIQKLGLTRVLEVCINCFTWGVMRQCQSTINIINRVVIILIRNTMEVIVLSCSTSSLLTMLDKETFPRDDHGNVKPHLRSKLNVSPKSKKHRFYREMLTEGTELVRMFVVLVHFQGMHIKKKLITQSKKIITQSKKINYPIKKKLLPVSLVSSGPLVLWSAGPLVLWSSGPLVLWSAGPLVLWSSGPLVRWSSGPLVLWSSGPLVLWSGPLVLWSSGPLVLWSAGPLVLWSSGRLVRWSSGPLVRYLNLSKT